MKTKRMTRREAEKLGFTVDTHCYPWVAYKGPRFAVTEIHPIRTPRSAGGPQLLKKLPEWGSFLAGSSVSSLT